jgi:hypothetical protein
VGDLEISLKGLNRENHKVGDLDWDFCKMTKWWKWYIGDMEISPKNDDIEKITKGGGGIYRDFAKMTKWWQCLGEMEIAL